MLLLQDLGRRRALSVTGSSGGNPPTRFPVATTGREVSFERSCDLSPTRSLPSRYILGNIRSSHSSLCKPFCRVVGMTLDPWPWPNA
jgi:hypothetical protein